MAYRFETLNWQDLERVSRNQIDQQESWRRVPAEGCLVACCGEDFIVLPNVFPPRGDTQLFIDNMEIPPGSVVLDMGTGSGVLAVFAVLKGAASVVAVDINDDAIRNAQMNAARFGMKTRIEVRLSDGFSSFSDAETFDVILANLPGRSESASDPVEAAQWDTGFQLHKSFFEKAPLRLKPNGKVIMTKANYPELNTVAELAERAGFQITVLAKKEPKADDFRTYYALSFHLNR